MSKPSIHLLVIVLLLLTPTVAAAWSSAPHLNDAICTDDGHQWPIGICSDGSEGYLVAWGTGGDDRNPYHVYVQHLDADGNRLWGDGQQVYGSYGNLDDWAMCRDGSGGAYLAVCDQVGGVYYTVVVQHVEADGSVPWGLQGMIATTGAVDAMQDDVVMIETGYGSAYVIWSDLRNSVTSGRDLWMQSVNASGPAWGSIGVNVCNRPGHQWSVCADRVPSGGVVLAWMDGRDLGINDYDIYAQRLDGGGSRLWTFTGVPVSAHPEHQWGPVIASDGTEGAYIAWEDYRDAPTSSSDVFAQHLDASGARQGVVNGTGVCWQDGASSRIGIVPDRNGGAYVAWADTRDNGFDGTTLYAQRLGNNAAPMWNTAGVIVCASDGSQGGTGFAMGTDDGGDLILVWNDQRNLLNDLYAQRMSSTTALQWAPQGLLVSSAPDRQEGPRMVTEMDGSCVVVWQDHRPDVDSDIYLQRIDGQGILGLPVSGVGDPAWPAVVLQQNVPNPFNPVTTIAFELAEPARVSLQIHDAAGRRVRTLLAGEVRAAGPGEVSWNGFDDHGRPASAGVYFYRLEAGDRVETRRMVLVK